MPAPMAIGRVARTARRLAPFAMEAYRRWERLSPEEKERYRRRAQRVVDRGRYAYERRQMRRGGGPR